MSLILDDLGVRSRETAQAWKVKAGYERRQTVMWRVMTLSVDKEEPPRSVSNPFVHTYVIEALVKLLKQYGEGALVALVMLDIAIEKPWLHMLHEKNKSLAYNMRTHVPALVGHEPLEIMLVLDRLNEILAGCKIETDCGKYYFLEDGGNAYAEQEAKEYGSKSGILALNVPRQRSEIIKEMGNDRDDMQGLARYMQSPLRAPDLAAVSKDNELIKTYLMRRACDIARYGVKVADITFPQPTLKETSTSFMLTWQPQPGFKTIGVPEVVSSMVEWLLRGEVEREEGWKKERLQRIKEAEEGERRALAVMGNAQLPDNLKARVLSGNERDMLRSACRDECGRYAYGKAVLNVIKAFVYFCELLARPENHIKVRSGQFVEKPVRSRTEIDMVNEMARELVGLPKYTAYARVAQNIAGEQKIWKGKIRTAKI
jgi:hypothetical protein